MTDKQQLRSHFKKLRQALSEDQLEALSIAVANRSLELPIWDARYYHIFLTIEKQREIDTHFMLHILQGRDKSVVVSKANFEDQSMVHFLLEEHTVLELSPFGIPEPSDGLQVAPEQLDVVFVPLLAFDQKGLRVGYGKGFYDRFLAQCREDCIFVGLSFFDAVDSIDAESLDIPLHFVVTPEKIYRF